MEILPILLSNRSYKKYDKSNFQIAGRAILYLMWNVSQHTIIKHCGPDIREHDFLVHNQLLKQLTHPVWSWFVSSVAPPAGHLDVVCLLVSQGAEISCKDKRGYTPLHTAASSGQIAVVKHLLNLAVEVRTHTHTHAHTHTYIQTDSLSHLASHLRKITHTPTQAHAPNTFIHCLAPVS